MCWRCEKHYVRSFIYGYKLQRSKGKHHTSSQGQRQLTNDELAVPVVLVSSSQLEQMGDEIKLTNSGKRRSRFPDEYKRGILPLCTHCRETSVSFFAFSFRACLRILRRLTQIKRNVKCLRRSSQKAAFLSRNSISDLPFAENQILSADRTHIWDVCKQRIFEEGRLNALSSLSHFGDQSWHRVFDVVSCF